MKLLNLGRRKYVKLAILLFLFLTIGVKGLTGSFFIIMALGATVDSATGSFTVDSTPDVHDVQFVNGTTYALISTLYPDNSALHGVNFTIDHNGQMQNLYNVTVYRFCI